MMKSRFLAFAAAFLCCCSCVDIDYSIGENLLPTNKMFDVYASDKLPIKEIDMKMLDSISGYSTLHITIGSIMEETFGLTTRSSALTLVPMYSELDFGKNPEVKSFHFAAALDSTSYADFNQENILQNLKVYELSEPLNEKKDYNINGIIKHKSTRINKGCTLNGSDSLAFDFTEEFAQKFVDNYDPADLKDASLKEYFRKFPGIYIETDKPLGKGGRINMFNLQLGYNSSGNYLEGNFAKLNLTSTYNGVKKDTSFYFYYGARKLENVDSLLTNSSTGNFPQYALNLTGNEESRSKVGNAGETILVEGGGGLKPHIKATTLVDLANEAISKAGHNPKDVIVNKATIVLPFEFPDDYRQMFKYPKTLSPTCKIVKKDSVSFANITDYSNQSENQGVIDRNNLVYSPDITYHLRECIELRNQGKESKLASGIYDIWFIILYNETYNTSASSSELNELYQNMAYQSYYNTMYGNGGYSYYDNYYSYMMAAQYDSQASYTSTTTLADRDRFYCAKLNGPESKDGRVPYLKIVYSIAKK